MFIKFLIFENLGKKLTISNNWNSKKLFSSIKRLYDNKTYKNLVVIAINDAQHLLNIPIELNRPKRSVTDILNPPPSSQIGNIISKSKASNAFIPDTATFVLKKLTFPVDKCLYSSEIKNQNIARYKWTFA